MLSLLKRFAGSKSYPLNRIIVSQNQLIVNYQILNSVHQSIRVAPVLKSNAYGHGIGLVGKTLDSQSIEELPFICVDSLFEAYQLQKVGVKIPILIMGYIDPQSLKRRRRFPFEYAVFDFEFAKVLNAYQPGAKIHLFVDTGMNREGIIVNELPEFLRNLKQLPNLKVVGLMSHFASADEPTSSQNIEQLENFKKAKQIALEYFPEIKWFHFGGSYGLLNDQIGQVINRNKLINLVRVGKALFGVLTPKFRQKNPHLSNLKPILNMKTKIAQIKQVGPTQKVGYSGSFITKNPVKIGILPIGYNDGVDRRLSNNGVVFVEELVKKGQLKKVSCPIIGKVSMNITTIDISNVKNPKVGQIVEIYSNNPEDKNSIENSAEICQTIPYELLVHLNPTTRRELG